MYFVVVYIYIAGKGNMADLFEFLKERNVPEEEIQLLKDDEVRNYFELRQY
jgi:hypothetical protein